MLAAMHRLAGCLQARQHWLLLGLLVLLHGALMAGPETPLGQVLWLADMGVFLLWQPFVQAERRLSFSQLSIMLGVLVLCTSMLNDWLLIFWVAILAAIVGGWVMFVEHRATRVFYLLAFAYLVSSLLVWLVPQIVPDTSAIGVTLEREFKLGMPLLFLVMASIPVRDAPRRDADIIDFFYSLFIFLLLAVMLLGSLAFMLLRRSSYLESVFYTVIVVATLLLLLSWAWNPRAGFAGIGVLFSRYLLSVAMPFEQWLGQLTLDAESEADPERFLQRALAGMTRLPWVDGGEWSVEGRRGTFGVESWSHHQFSGEPLSLTLHTRHQLSPALLWHFQMLTRLVGEFYQAKVRGRALQRMNYVQAVHETGARLTHDVKNLLQSLNNLCYVAQSADPVAGQSAQQLIQRQLPAIALRLRQTLDKLQNPGVEPGSKIELGAWWTELKQRYAQEPIAFPEVGTLPARQVPATLLDSVADNLLQNALAKRQQQGDVGILVELAADDGLVLRVRDTGSAVSATVAADLFNGPVTSEMGLGIGLYQAARQASELGFDLRLAANRDGGVVFELVEVGRSDSASGSV